MPSILVTGATGAVGRLVVQGLLAAGHRVHALCRTPATAGLPAAVRCFQGDLTQAPPPGALDGVTQVFLFPAQGSLEPFLAPLAAAGVRHLVVLSSLSAALEHERDRHSVTAQHHLAVERAAQATGLPCTLLRPGSFANNLRMWAGAIRASGQVTGPYPLAAQAPIHEADIADVAVAALSGPALVGRTLPMTGPDVLTRVQQLEVIAQAIGRPLQFRECTPEQFAADVGRFVPAPVVKLLLDYWKDTTVTPEVSVSVESLLGKPGRGLKRWAADHARDFS